MNVVVDTSVWVQHFRQGEPPLAALLVTDRVRVHPLVLGELACGTQPERGRTLRWLAAQQRPSHVGLDDVLAFVERERLYGLGCGVVDATLLASTLLTPQARLWTRDRHLATLAERFAAGYRDATHQRSASRESGRQKGAARRLRSEARDRRADACGPGALGARRDHLILVSL